MGEICINLYRFTFYSATRLAAADWTATAD